MRMLPQFNEIIIHPSRFFFYFKSFGRLKFKIFWFGFRSCQTEKGNRWVLHAFFIWETYERKSLDEGFQTSIFSKTSLLSSFICLVVFNCQTSQFWTHPFGRSIEEYYSCDKKVTGTVKRSEIWKLKHDFDRVC